MPPGSTVFFAPGFSRPAPAGGISRPAPGNLPTPSHMSSEISRHLFKYRRPLIITARTEANSPRHAACWRARSALVLRFHAAIRRVRSASFLPFGSLGEKNMDPNFRDKPEPQSVYRPVEEQPAREHAPTKPGTEGLSENVAGMLCYLFGWVSGLIFLLADRRPFVRFHAAQSVAVFATLSILLLALSGFFLGSLIPGIAGVLFVLRRLLDLIWLVAAVVLMLKAAGGERFRVRFASHYADRAAHGAS